MKKIKDIKGFKNINPYIPGIQWATYLTHPYGKYIYEGKSDLIIKSIPLKKHINEEMYLCSDKIYGTIVFKEPVGLSKKEFLGNASHHNVSKNDAENFWGDNRLYKYKFSFFPFETPLKYYHIPTFQTFTQIENISFEYNYKTLLKGITNDDFDMFDDFDILHYHNYLHKLFFMKLNTINYNIIINAHRKLVKEYENRNMKMDAIDELDKKSIIN